MLSQQEIDDLFSGRLPEKEMQERLETLTPDQVDYDLFVLLVEEMRERLEVSLDIDASAFDCSGSDWMGRYRFDTFTTVAFVMAAGGVKVAKFTGRAPFPSEGSYSLIEQLGFSMEMPSHTIEQLYSKAGLVFLYAPQFYPSLKTFSDQWKSLVVDRGVDSIFKYIMPLLNPVQPRYRLISVADPFIQPMLANYLADYTRLKKGLVTRSENGSDIAHTGKTHVYEVQGMDIEKKVIQTAYGGEPPKEARHLTPEENLDVFHQLVAGEGQDSIYGWRVCLNAGAGFYAANKASSVSEGMVMASELLSGGKVKETVERCRKVLAAAHVS